MKKKMVVLILLLAGMLSAGSAFKYESALDPAAEKECLQFQSQQKLNSEKLRLKVEAVCLAVRTTGNSIVALKQDEEKGFLVFKNDYTRPLYYSEVPAKKDLGINEINVFASRGEKEPLSFGVYPLREGDVNISLTDLKDREGDVLSAVNFKLGYVASILKTLDEKTIVVSPELIICGNKAKMIKGVSRQIWITADIPENAKPGVYEGSLVLSLSGGAPEKLKIKATVYPFKLIRNPALSFSWNDNPRSTQALLEYASHGDNVLAGGDIGPDIKSVSKGRVQLDFLRSDKYLESAKEAGIGRVGIIIMMHKYINDLKNHFKVETLSGDFDKIYVNTIEQIRDWANEKKVKVEFSLIDAESEGCYLICWRLDGTLKLVALAKKIPGISFSVDCPADVFKGENLLPLLDTGIDIVSFNSSSACSNVIRKAKELKKEIRFYSGGRNRISWGFLPWKHGSTGRIELCNYSFDITPENCFTVSQYTSYLSKGPYFYPKKDGDVICTPAFEMNREGIDDYAYIYTLECAIKKSLESKDGRVAAAAEEAKAFLKKLKDSIPQYADDPAATAPEDQGQLDNWRKEIAERIETLTAH